MAAPPGALGKIDRAGAYTPRFFPPRSTRTRAWSVVLLAGLVLCEAEVGEAVALQR